MDCAPRGLGCLEAGDDSDEEPTAGARFSVGVLVAGVAGVAEAGAVDEEVVLPGCSELAGLATEGGASGRRLRGELTSAFAKPNSVASV